MGALHYQALAHTLPAPPYMGGSKSVEHAPCPVAGPYQLFIFITSSVRQVMK